MWGKLIISVNSRDQPRTSFLLWTSVQPHMFVCVHWGVNADFLANWGRGGGRTSVCLEVGAGSSCCVCVRACECLCHKHTAAQMAAGLAASSGVHVETGNCRRRRREGTKTTTTLHLGLIRNWHGQNLCNMLHIRLCGYTVDFGMVVWLSAHERFFE